MEIVASAFKGMQLHYRSRTETVLISFPARATEAAFLLETPGEVEDLFAAVTQFWRANCGGARLYWVVDYRNFNFHPACAGAYAGCLQTFMDMAAITVVRYGGSQELRRLVRASTQQLHLPTNLYASREEALEVIAGLRAGFIRLGPHETHGAAWLGSLLCGLLMLCLTACSHPQLSDAGRQVLLVSAPPPTGCQVLGPLVGHAYGTFLYGDTLQTPAINDLTNQAAQRGATHVQLLSTDPSAHACRARGVALQCQ